MSIGTLLSRSRAEVGPYSLLAIRVLHYVEHTSLGLLSREYLRAAMHTMPMEWLQLALVGTELRTFTVRMSTFTEGRALGVKVTLKASRRAP